MFQRIIPPAAALAAAFATAACSGTSDGSDPALEADADLSPGMDAEPAPDAAVPTPDADLTDHGSVELDGAHVVFDSTRTYRPDNGLGEVTISGDLGSDCPLGSECTTLYVSFPDGEVGAHSCDELHSSIQLTIGEDRYFPFDHTSAGCTFSVDELGVDAGEQVAISGLQGTLALSGAPSNLVTLENGELRATLH
jgi:hypothetical protein